MKKLLCLMMFLLLCPAALAETAWTDVPDLIRPGKTVRLHYTVDGGDVTVRVSDEFGQQMTVPAQGITAAEGPGAIIWDGCADGAPLLPGYYYLDLVCGDREDYRLIEIGAPAPTVSVITADEELGSSWSADIEAGMDGTLTVTAMLEDDALTLIDTPVTQGTHTVTWTNDTQQPLPEGEFDLVFRLTDDTGFSSSPEIVSVWFEVVSEPHLARDVEYHTPNENSEVLCDHDVCYWKMNMGELNEDLIWQVLTQPVTVLKGDERKQCRVRALPDEGCREYVGEVTYASQAVHVLERGETWSLIEAYSSSVEGSSVKVYATHFQGYVKTSLLQEKKVSQKVGLVIDKLQQRLYVFKDGQLYSTLLCSTGFARADTPWNETPAGEFIAISWTGGFWSGSLFCDKGIRINDGILLHEVPCTIEIQPDGSEKRDYFRCERYLGEKASHGCVRIQKEKGINYVNAAWLWDNLGKKENAKVIIWDEIGRVLDYPSDDLTLYYNPNGGKQYHSVENCPIVREALWPLTPFRYDQLDEDPFASLTRCPGCAPQLRREEVDVVNEKNDRQG
ncbi:MAG: L,D-transpeptidase [Clostridia bacterium]|nr:L,D-transpeptidase [Clostridia bacterium]